MIVARALRELSFDSSVTSLPRLTNTPSFTFYHAIGLQYPLSPVRAVRRAETLFLLIAQLQAPIPARVEYVIAIRSHALHPMKVLAKSPSAIAGNAVSLVIKAILTLVLDTIAVSSETTSISISVHWKY